MKKTYAIVDLETTGSSFKRGDRIIQFGCSLLQEGKIVQEFNITINPGRKIPELIEKLTGIKNKDVKDAPYFEDVCDFIYNMLEGCVFVAHNVHFDYHFLNSSFQEVGMPALSLRALDTVELTKVLFPTLSSYRLSDLSNHFDLTHDSAHDAASDAHATAELFLHLRQKADRLPLVTLEKLTFLSEHCQVDNASFFYESYEAAKELRLPLPDKLYVKNGLALKEKEIRSEQTAYREKEISDFPEVAKHLLEECGLEIRSEQVEMMQTIFDFQHAGTSRNLAIEAAPGIGKTLAYLLPAAFRATPESKIMVSTSTLLLQEQIMENELTRLRKMVPFELQVSSLKGKTNIIQLEKLAGLVLESLTKKESLIMMSIFVWLTETETGDVSELSQAQNFDFLREKLTYESQEPPLTGRWADDDFYAFNNQKAEKSSLIVTNHSFLSHHIDDPAVFGQSSAMTLILDEAHQFPRIYQDAHKRKFALSILKRRLRRFGYFLKDFREAAEKDPAAESLDYDLFNFEFAIDRSHQACAESEELLVQALIREIGEKGEVYLDEHFLVENGLKKIFRKMHQYLQETRLAGLRCMEKANLSADAVVGPRAKALLHDLAAVQEELQHFLEAREGSYHVLQYAWEHDLLTLAIELNRIDFSEEIHSKINERFARAIYLSSTLRVDDCLDHFKSKIGETELQEAIFASPYDLKERLRIFLPRGITNITRLEDKQAAKQIVSTLLETALPLQRKTLILFTSNRLLEEVHNQLKVAVAAGFPGTEILAQGFSGSRRRMHNRFMSAETAILLGSASYWEGIDFSDQAVEILVITRLPFDPPHRPENAAFQAYHLDRGKKAFYEEFLPRAMVRLKQGVGRLVRSKDAKGVVICLDDRLTTSNYSKRMQQMLPAGVAIKVADLTEIKDEIQVFLKK
ncbi:helicase C-terminal domain-containing protein [Trichococcus ilyis]|uniref:3'-5' exonuclease DinG n=1 Tax=Trichococcus ilyis TaxID=640938 RepID=A0A143Y5B5_9LACT|nr:helicase C-terminal domain-containing protein [Trichococcus ilyis]CZQ82085.1 dead/deah box helicase [Trichococcus ilyis]SEI51267.1 ATP-dependent DNA helicase DinG [Trichococcus ilyis]